MIETVPKRIGKTTTQVTVRLDDEMLERIDAVAVHYSEKLGTAFGRSDAARMVMARGLDVVETEIAPPKKTRK